MLRVIRKIGKIRGCRPSPTIIWAASSRFKATIITIADRTIIEMGRAKGFTRIDPIQTKVHLYFIGNVPLKGIS
jgi:hypothetical protein